MPEGVWRARTCPWCGGPPAFAEVVDGGRRRLSCHLCGGAWTASALGCAFCGTVESDVVAVLPDEHLEDGARVEACGSCRSYLKDVDRRRRFPAASPLVLDWSTPHLDVSAMRRGYRRPTPSLAHLVDDAGGDVSPAS
jgi:FdhE protein